MCVVCESYFQLPERLLCIVQGWSVDILGLLCRVADDQDTK